MSEHEHEPNEPVAPPPVETPEPTPDDEPVTEPDDSAAPGDEPDAAPEPEPPSQAVGAVGERELEKMMKRVDAENARYAKKLGDIMGDEATVLEQCPRCAKPFFGFIFPPMMQPVDAETKDRVLVSVGDPPALAVKRDPYSRGCDVCDGVGAVLTGSRRNEEKAIRCLPCGGRGWVPVGDERRVGRSDIQPATATNGHADVATNDLAPPPPPSDEDLWGRRVGDPNYGVHPMYVANR